MRTKLSAAVIIFFVLSAVQGHAWSSRTISEKNEFGGATIEYIYQNGDEFYNKFGIERSISFYDYAKKFKQIEYYYLPAAAKEKGFGKRTEYYNDRQKVSSADVFHTEDFAREKFYTRHTEYYDERGRKVRMDYFFTPEYAGKNGYDKATQILSEGFVREWDYYYTPGYIDQNGISIRKDFYVSDQYGKEKVKDTVLYDRETNEIKRDGK